MKTRKLREVPILCSIALWIMLFQAVPSLFAASVPVFARDSVVYGRSYGDWAAAWNQWSTSIPVSIHPLFDNPPVAPDENGFLHEDISVGQAGPVWFLGGKYCSNTNTNCGAGVAKRAVTIPAGKALFFPIVDSEDSIAEDPRNAGLINGLRQYAANNIDPLTSSDVTLEFGPANGTLTTIPNLIPDFRVQSPAFGFMLPSDNIYNALYAKKNLGSFSAGTYFPGVDDGIFVMLKPLPPGQYTLHFHAYLAQYNFTVDITYLITQL